IRAAPAETAEFGIWKRALVFGIGEAALAVGLPDLQHAIRHRHPVAIEHTALDPDAIAGNVRRHEGGGEGVVPVVLADRRQPIFEERTDGLRWRNVVHCAFSMGVAFFPRSTMSKR